MPRNEPKLLLSFSHDGQEEEFVWHAIHIIDVSASSLLSSPSQWRMIGILGNLCTVRRNSESDRGSLLWKISLVNVYQYNVAIYFCEKEVRCDGQFDVLTRREHRVPVSGQTLFWAYLWACFYMRLTFGSMGWVKKIALPNVRGY